MRGRVRRYFVVGTVFADDEGEDEPSKGRILVRHPKLPERFGFEYFWTNQVSVLYSMKRIL